MVKRKTTPGKLPREDKVFANLVQQILDQTHVDRHFQLVEADGTPCTSEAGVDARLRALVREQKPDQKNHCYVSVVSTYCIENGCPNAEKIQSKILCNIIKVLGNGTLHSRVWCDLCKQTAAFADIIPKLLEKHPNKHFIILHPVTKAHCTNASDIMTALHAYRLLQPKTQPTHLKVFAKSTHTVEGGCKCAEFIKEYRLSAIAFNCYGPGVRVWSKECAKSTTSANVKAMQPKGQNTNHDIESTRQTMLAQIEQLTALSIIFDNIQQGRVYDVLIRKKLDTLGAAVQLASGCTRKNGGSAHLNKTFVQIINVLESRALFIGQEISRDGKFLRVLVLPPSTLPRVKDIKAKQLYLSHKIVTKFKEFVFEFKQPDHMLKMAQIIEAHIADPTSLRMDMRTANAHVDNFKTFLEHIGIEAILKNHYKDTGAGIRILDFCQGDFVAFQKVVEVKTLHLAGKLHSARVKPMHGVDMLIGLVLASDVRVKARHLFSALKNRRRQRLPCYDLLEELEKVEHVIDGIFKFVDPMSSIRQCPNDKRGIYVSMSQIDGKVVKSRYIYDMTKASYIDTTNVPNRDLLALIFN